MTEKSPSQSEQLYAPLMVFGVLSLLVAGLLWLLMPLNDCPWGDPLPCGAKWTLGEILVVAIPFTLGVTLLLALALLRRNHEQRQ